MIFNTFIKFIVSRACPIVSMNELIQVIVRATRRCSKIFNYSFKFDPKFYGFRHVLTIFKTKDYQQAIADLKEDMIEEQREARVEDDRLKQEINVTSEKINEQRKKNSTKKG